MIKLKFSLKRLDEESLTNFVIATNSLERDTPFDIYVSDTRKARSTSQNRYYWAVVIKELSDLWGFDKEDVHEILKVKFLKRTTYDLGGEIIEAALSSRVLNTVEFTKYLDSIRQWALEKFGLYIPQPHEMNDRHYVENVNDTNH